MGETRALSRESEPEWTTGSTSVMLRQRKVEGQSSLPSTIGRGVNVFGRNTLLLQAKLEKD